MRWIALLAVCYSLQDLNNARCESLCVRDGYTTGWSKKKGCQCIDEKPSIADYTTRSASIGEPLAVPFKENQAKSGDINVYFPGKLDY